MFKFFVFLYHPNVSFALYYNVTTRQRCIRVILRYNDKANWQSRFILRCNDGGTLYLCFITLQRLGNVAFAFYIALQ